MFRDAAVLDTNVVLDWFVFHDPAAVSIARAVGTRALQWLRCQSMRDELAHVLAHAELGHRRFDLEQVLTSTDRLCLECPMPTLQRPNAIRCRDPSDQVFVDLALQADARWLITRDRALLALARKVRPFGLDIVTPEVWASRGRAAT